MKLLSISNYVPEQIADMIRFDQYQPQSFRQPHYCPYLSECISCVLDRADVDGVVFPSSCDSARSMDAYLMDSGKFVHKLDVPAIGGELGVQRFAQSIQEFRLKLEGHFAVAISEHGISERSAMLRERGKHLAKLYDSLQYIRYSDYIAQINDMLKHPLDKWQTFAPDGHSGSGHGKPIYLVGSFIQDPTLLSELEDSGLRVAGDNATNSKRLFANGAYAGAVSRGDTPISAAAREILEQRRSPVLDTFACVWERDWAEITRKGIRAVIFLTQQYCEPYDYLYALYQEKLSAAGVPLFRVHQSRESSYALRFATIESMLS